jgi:ABC-type branched-subunit amino acid transport system substrate-binding protein
MAVAALLATGCGSSAVGGGDKTSGGTESGAIPIGVLVPLTGSSSSAGMDMLNAAKLAADGINEAGGVLGRKVRIVPGDDACDPQAGTAAAQKMVVSKVVGVAGGYCSSASIPETAVLDPEGIPFISAASTHPELTERGFHTVFRTIGRDDQQGPFAVRFLTGPVGAKRIAIVHDNTTYSKGLAEQTRDANGRLGTGAEIVLFDAITPGESDYSSTLTKIKASGADTFYFTGYFAEGGLLVRQARALGLTATLVGGDSTQDPTLVKTAGPAAEGFMCTTAPLPAFLPGAAGFVESYTKRFGSAPGPYSVYEHDAVTALVAGISRAGSVDPEKVTAALRKTRITGLTGEISFDVKGDREKTVYVTAIVKDGKFVPYKKLDAGGNWIDS